MSLHVRGVSTAPLVSESSKVLHPFQLCDVSFDLAVGERLALVGPNGSGKSTLFRMLLGACALESGSVSFDAACAESTAQRGRGFSPSEYVDFAYVGQDPQSCFVTSTVEEEVAFGPCNLNLSVFQVKERVSEALEACGIAHLRQRSLTCLSGGQQQLVCLAAALALRPHVLLLDEPYSMLDGTARRRVVDALARLNPDVSVIQTSHRMDELEGFNRVLALKDGRVFWQGTPEELEARKELACMFGLRETSCAAYQMRSYDAVFRAMGWLRQDGTLFPDSVVGAMCDVDDSDTTPHPDSLQASCCSYSQAVHPSETFGRFSSQTSQDAPFSLQDFSLALVPGKLTLLVGDSGSGKSTCARLLAGLIKPDSGRILLSSGPVSPGDVGYVFQRVEDQLFKSTVMGDVSFGPRNKRLNRREALNVAEKALGEVGLDAALYAESNPLCLSGGQKRRVGFAGVLALQSAFLIFDEPTIGLDAFGVHDFLALLERQLAHGRGVLVVTHELETFLPLAHAAVVLADGQVVGAYRRGTEPAGEDAYV